MIPDSFVDGIVGVAQNMYWTDNRTYFAWTFAIVNCTILQGQPRPIAKFPRKFRRHFRLSYGTATDIQTSKSFVCGTWDNNNVAIAADNGPLIINSHGLCGVIIFALFV